MNILHQAFVQRLRKLLHKGLLDLHMHLVDAVLSSMDFDWKAFNKHISSGLIVSKMTNVAPWMMSTRRRELFDSVR